MRGERGWGEETLGGLLWERCGRRTSSVEALGKVGSLSVALQLSTSNESQDFVSEFGANFSNRRLISVSANAWQSV